MDEATISSHQPMRVKKKVCGRASLAFTIRAETGHNHR